MYYSLCVATDFRGHKVNLQFFFDDNRGPQLAQVLSRATEAFNQFFKSKGIVDRPFSITTAVIFNERYETWDRLERSAQLVHNGQIYLFQPDVNDVPAEIPDPINAAQFLAEYISPQRSFAGSNANYAYDGERSRSASPGAQIPASYDPYYRKRYLEQSPAYQPHYVSSSYGPIPPTTRPYVPSYAYQAPAAASSVTGTLAGAKTRAYDGYPTDVNYHYSYSSSSNNAYSYGNQPTSRPAGSSPSPDPSRARSLGVSSQPGPKSLSRADLESNPDYIALMQRATSVSSQRRAFASDLDGPSIFAEERRHDAELSRLDLDQYREVVRSEARDFTPSPSRERVF